MCELLTIFAVALTALCFGGLRDHNGWGGSSLHNIATTVLGGHCGLTGGFLTDLCNRCDLHFRVDNRSRFFPSGWGGRLFTFDRDGRLFHFDGSRMVLCARGSDRRRFRRMAFLLLLSSFSNWSCDRSFVKLRKGNRIHGNLGPVLVRHGCVTSGQQRIDDIKHLLCTYLSCVGGCLNCEEQGTFWPWSFASSLPRSPCSPETASLARRV